VRTIVAGSRGVVDPRIVAAAMAQAKEQGIAPTSVVSGTARGVDQLGEQWAEDRHLLVHRYPADWDRYGKRAGYVRNKEMAENADALVAVWDGISRGTKHMIDLARWLGLPVYVHRVGA
jgi:hypothetical protein